MKKLTGICCICLFGAVLAADPPDIVNYQGVLRDATDNPLEGDHDMSFRFFDAASAGTPILYDEHLAVGTGAVTITGGLFNVGLGSGNVQDDTGPGTYSLLSDMFRDYGSVWVEIQVGAEILTPRIPVRAAPYAHNADTVGGIEPSTFLNTSATSQTKSGNLTVDGTITGSDLTADGTITANGGVLVMVGDSTIATDGGLTSLSMDISNDGTDEFLLDGFGKLNLSGSLSLSGSAEQFYWNSVNGFTLSDNLQIHGTVDATEVLIGGGTLGHDGGAFTANDDLTVAGTLQVGNGLVAPKVYNHFGGGSPGSGDMTNNGDLYLAGDLEVAETLYADGIKINSDGPDGNRSMYFYEDNSSVGEYLRWNNLDDRFELSDQLQLVTPGEVQLILFDDLNDFDAQPGITFKTNSGSKVFSWRGGFNYFRMTDNLLIDGYVDTYELRIGSGALQWDSGQSRFEFTQPVAVNGALRIGTNAGTVAAYSFIGPSGSASPDSSAMNSVNDLYVAGDLEAQTYWGDTFESSTGTFNLNGDDNRFNSTGQHRIMIDSDNSTTGNFVGWYHDGTYSTSTQLARMEEDGDFKIGGTLSQNQVFDLAESFWASEPLKPGDLVVADPNHPGAVLKATTGTDRAVLGVVSEKPGVLLGSAPFDADGLRKAWGEKVHGRFMADRARLEVDSNIAEQGDIETVLLERFFDENIVAVALAGRVPVQVDASFGPIAVGDPLAPSDIPGVARKADGQTVAVAIALEPLASGRGTVLGFVTRFETTGLALAALETTVDERTPDPETGVQQVPGSLQVVLDQGADQQAQFSIHRNGATADKLGDEIFRVDESGNVFARGAFRPHAMDLAEFFQISEPVQAGHVIAIDLEHPGLCRLASEPNDPTVIGIVSTEPGLLLGGSVQRIASVDPELAAELEHAREAGDRKLEEQLWNRLTTRFMESHAAVALSGTAPVLVDAGYGAIHPGDLLISSPTPGHAMRAVDPAPGAVIGKALAGLDSGTGIVRVLIFLR